MTSKRRKSRCPIFEVRPSLTFPPLECWRGVSPIQAAKSRPRLKVFAGGAIVSTAVAMIGPKPAQCASD
jgi:hypothetical protein